MVVFNWPGLDFGKVQIILNNPEMIKDFMEKENDSTVRDNQGITFPHMNLGFVQRSGKDGLKMRAIFSEFFLYDR